MSQRGTRFDPRDFVHDDKVEHRAFKKQHRYSEEAARAARSVRR
jgi:hypothetical protein